VINFCDPLCLLDFTAAPDFCHMKIRLFGSNPGAKESSKAVLLTSEKLINHSCTTSLVVTQLTDLINFCIHLHHHLWLQRQRHSLPLFSLSSQP
jgi:hypothetical protein